MKKVTGKVLAAVATMALGVSTLAGCTSAPKADSMFEVANIASQLDSYSYSVEFSMDSDGETAEIELYGKCSKEAVSLSFKADINDEKYKLEDLLIATPTAMYVNLDLIEKELLADMDLGTYGIDAEWISIEWDEMEQTEVDTTLYDTLSKDLEEGYKDLIDKKDGKYVLKIDDKDSVIEFLEATSDMLDANATDWSELIADTFNNVDTDAASEASTNLIKSAVSNFLMDINKTIDAGMTASEIDKLVEEAFVTDDEELEEDVQLEASELETSIDELITLIDSAIEEGKNSEEEEIGGELKVTAYQKNKSYVTEVELTAEEDEDSAASEFKYTYTITSEDVKISIPTEDVMTIGEAVGNMMLEFGYDSSIEDIIDSMESTDVESMLNQLPITGMMGSGAFDEDYYDDYYDDYYSDLEW